MKSTLNDSPVTVQDRDILGGVPVFAGTRVPVKTLFDYLKTNQPLAEFLDDFPTVQPQQARAVLEQAGEAAQTNEVLVGALPC